MLPYHIYIKIPAKCSKYALAVFMLSMLVMLCLACKTQSKAEKEDAPPEASRQSEISFDNLPAEVQKYLADIRVAFARHDESSLAAQGEKLYEADLRRKVPPQQYIAMLYRIGPYAKDSTWEIPAYMFDLNRVKNITYTDFAVQGPVLSVDAIIDTAGNVRLPCKITLLWRAKDLKIIGAYP